MAAAASAPKIINVQVPIWTKFSIHAPVSKPTNSRGTPGKAGSTVPTKPSKIKIPLMIQPKMVISIPVLWRGVAAIA